MAVGSGHGMQHVLSPALPSQPPAHPGTCCGAVRKSCKELVAQAKALQGPGVTGSAAQLLTSASALTRSSTISSSRLSFGSNPCASV